MLALHSGACARVCTRISCVLSCVCKLNAPDQTVKMKMRGLLLMPPISVNIFNVESLIFSFTLTTREGEMDVLENPVWEITGGKILCIWTATTKKNHFF